MKDYLDLLLLLREEDAKEGYINRNEVYSYPNIPEIGSAWEDVCCEIHDYMVDEAQKDQNEDVDDSTIVWRILTLTYGWCAFAGIGATWHWYVNWESLEKKGISATLTEPRGYFAMDDYVVECIGISSGSDEEKELRERLRERREKLFWITNESEDAYQQMFECMRAMFEYGIQLEMYRLGMK